MCSWPKRTWKVISITKIIFRPRIYLVKLNIDLELWVKSLRLNLHKVTK